MEPETNIENPVESTLEVEETVEEVASAQITDDVA